MHTMQSALNRTTNKPKFPFVRQNEVSKWRPPLELVLPGVFQCLSVSCFPDPFQLERGWIEHTSLHRFVWGATLLSKKLILLQNQDPLPHKTLLA
jgi:hypothetical protein